MSSWDGTGPALAPDGGGADWGDMQAGILGTPYFFVLVGEAPLFFAEGLGQLCLQHTYRSD